MVANLVDEMRIFWSDSSDQPAPETIRQFGAQMLSLRCLIDDPSPAIIFVDCSNTDANAEIEKLRIEACDEHYLIAVLRELTVERVASLVACGAQDAATVEDLLNPVVIIERARCQTRLLGLARRGNIDFAALQNHAHGMASPVFFKDMDGRFTGCNEAFERLLGIDRPGIIGKTSCDVAPSDLALGCHQADLDLIADGGLQTQAARVRNAKGIVCMLRFYRGVIHDKDGRLTGIVGAIHDMGALPSRKTGHQEIGEATCDSSASLAAHEDSASAADQDRALLERVAAGDAAALACLYRRYHRRLARFLTRLTWKCEVIDEIINDTFMVVWKRAANFRGEACVSTWIIGIAYRSALRALRDQRRSECEPLDASHADSMAQYRPDHELSDLLEKALDQLPVEQRIVMALAYVLGHSVSEIAAITGCPATTVKARMHRARCKLRETLDVVGLTKGD